MGSRWWDVCRSVFSLRSQSSDLSAGEDALQLAAASWAPSQDQMTYPCGQLSGRCTSRPRRQIEEPVRRSRPAPQTAPPARLAVTHLTLRTHPLADLDRGLMPQRPQGQRHRDRIQRVAIGALKTRWQHRWACSAIHAQVPPHLDLPQLRLACRRPRPPDSPAPCPVPKKPQLPVGLVRCLAAARAVARPAGLDLRHKTRPRVDGDRAVYQSSRRFVQTVLKQPMASRSPPVSPSPFSDRHHDGAVGCSVAPSTTAAPTAQLSCPLIPKSIQKPHSRSLSVNAKPELGTI